MVSLDATPYYHCISRCVRRAFLCGLDTFSGKSYEHRREWIEQRLLDITDIFAIDVAAYAVMSNHYHVVLHIDKAQADNWTISEVIEHWHALFNGSLLSQRFIKGESLGSAERDALSEQVELWRQRLMSISWFMRCVNEPIAGETFKKKNRKIIAWMYSLIALLMPGVFPESMQMETGLVHVYFESAAVIIALVLLGQVLELRARSHTNTAIKMLLGLAPNTARIIREKWQRRRYSVRTSDCRRCIARQAG